MSVRAGRVLGLLACAAALAACDPELRGECAVPDDCPAGTSCQEGVCVADGSGSGDGGTASSDGGGGGACNPPCGADFHCLDGECAADFVAEIAVTSPASGTLAAGEPLEVRVRARAPGGVRQVVATLSGGPGPALTGECSSAGAAGEWKAILDLAQSTVGTGSYQLQAVLTRPDNTTLASAPVTVIVDKSGPTIVFEPVPYPPRCAASPCDHPAAGRFVRSEEVVIDARITDVPAGLGSRAPELSAPGMAGVVGQSMGGGLYRFRFPGRSPRFFAFDAPVPVEVAAADALGNAATAAGSFLLTRHRWAWRPATPAVINAAPAILGGRVFVGDDAGNVHAIERQGEQAGRSAWSQRPLPPGGAATGGAIVGHITAGQTNVYALSRSGYATALDAASGAQQWLCRSVSSPALLSTGPALALTPGPNGPEETLFLLTDNGALRAMRGSALRRVAGQGVCWIEGRYNSTNEYSVPAVVTDASGALYVWFGDPDGRLHKGQLGRETDGDFYLASPPGFTPPDFGAGIRGPVALVTAGAQDMVLFGTDGSYLRSANVAGTSLWSRAVGTQRNRDVLASPVAGADFVWAVNTRGLAQRYPLPGPGALQQSFTDATATRSNDAPASPVLASDGVVYFANGARLVAQGSDGTALWTASLPSSGAERALDHATPALACDGTMYVVANAAQDGELHAIVTDSPGLAGGWPKAAHDNRNTASYNAALPTPGSCTD